MRESRSLEKWMKLELSKIYGGIVTRKISLKKLLDMEKPSCENKDGEEHVFDRKVLDKIAEMLPSHKHMDLKLPINLHFDLKVENQCYITDEMAADLLRELEDFGDAYKFRDGKMWLPESIALDIIRRYPTVFQRVIFPG